jgi:hypothetical protein
MTSEKKKEENSEKGAETRYPFEAMDKLSICARAIPSGFRPGEARNGGFTRLIPPPRDGTVGVQ